MAESYEPIARPLNIGAQRARIIRCGDESAPVVLFLHGQSFSSEVWAQNGYLKAVADAGFQAVAVDFPGCGQSDNSLIPVDDWLYLCLQNAMIQRPVVVAPSMSGRFVFPWLTRPEGCDVAGFVPVAPLGIRSLSGKNVSIDCPTLVLWGENDTTIPLSEADRLIELIPGAKLEVIAEAGHAPYIDKPDEVLQRLLDFVRGIEGFQ